MNQDQPLRRVWGQDQSSGSGRVRAIVRRLRRKLGEDASPLTHSSPIGAAAIGWIGRSAGTAARCRRTR